LTEGRQALAVRLAGIEGGVECAGFAPLLSALADGEASAEQLARLRPHMKTCLSCRAQLKEFRAAPSRVAAFVPPVALVASAATTTAGPRGLWESLLGAAQQKVGALGERTHAAVELATGQKVAAVAASAAALAGGGTAVDHFARHEPPRPNPAPQTVEAKPVKEETPVPVLPEPAPVAEQPVKTEPAPAPAPAEPAPAPPPPPPPPPDPANEFAPTAAPAPTPQPAAPAPAAPAANSFAPGAGGSAGGSAGAGGGNEFGP
jgi:outer membrane biosynthesis protein TonB